MKRKDFIKSLAILSLSGNAMKLNALSRIAESFPETPLMPVLFLGHGNPMNAITKNEFSEGWQKLGNEITKPNAILCISAHWQTRGTFVTAMEKPATIHDFGGFPQALFDVQYPAPGSPDLADLTHETIKSADVKKDLKWGLDHGCWSVLTHVYPVADVPIVQLSLDYSKPAKWHVELAKELAVLRRKGILIIGSGNIVHNLGMINWNNDKVYDWAIEANEKVKTLITNDGLKQLTDYQNLGHAVQLAVPTPEHYLPLLYSLSLKTGNESFTFINDKIDMGSISMTSIKIS